MLKTGFRGERKRNPHPVPLPRRGECGDGKSKETTLFTHTQLSLATFKGENCGESFIR